MQAPEQVPGRNLQEFPPVLVAGASIRAAVESASAAGFNVFGVDLFGDHETRLACDQFQTPLDAQQDPKILQDWLLKMKPSSSQTLLIPTGGIQGVLTNAPGLSNCPGSQLAVEQVLRFGNLKYQMSLLSKVASTTGVGVPETTSFTSVLCEGKHTGRWLVKHSGSTAGLGVQWSSHSVRKNDCANVQYQMWKPGRALGVQYFADGKCCHLLGVFRSLYTRLGSCPFVYAGNYGPIHLDEQMIQKLETLGQKITSEGSIRGLFGVDLIVETSGQLWLLEINPRWTGASELIERFHKSVYELTSDRFSLFELHWRALNDSMFTLPLASRSTFRSLQSVPSTVPRYVKRVVFSNRNGWLDPNDLMDSISVSDQVELKDVPVKRLLVSKHDPIATLIMRFDGESCWQQKKRLLTNVREAVR